MEKQDLYNSLKRRADKIEECLKSMTNI